MRLVATVLAALALGTRAGTDGAMAYLFEQQLKVGKLEQLQGGKPIGVDIAGKLVPAVLKVGPLVHRGRPAGTSHFQDIHRYLVQLAGTGVALIIVFDGIGSRYPPKAVRAHAERAVAEQKARAEAARLDSLHVDGCNPAADTQWARVIHRDTFRDLVSFSCQLCSQLGLPWLVAPYEADHQLAYMATRGLIDHVLPPHNDSDLPVYGIPRCVPARPPPLPSHQVNLSSLLPNVNFIPEVVGLQSLLWGPR